MAGDKRRFFFTESQIFLAKVGITHYVGAAQDRTCLWLLAATLTRK
jgi:hypothetical protein